MTIYSLDVYIILGRHGSFIGSWPVQVSPELIGWLVFHFFKIAICSVHSAFVIIAENDIFLKFLAYHEQHVGSDIVSTSSKPAPCSTSSQLLLANLKGLNIIAGIIMVQHGNEHSLALSAETRQAVLPVCDPRELSVRHQHHLLRF